MIRRIWAALHGNDESSKELDRRHHEVMQALGDTRQEVQKLNSTINLALRELDSSRSKRTK